MSKLTDFLKLHIWEIPTDNKQQFNYPKAVAENFEKVDVNAKEVNEHLLQTDKEISNLKEEDNKTQQENEQLKSQIPIGQSSGEEITLNDSSNLPFKELKIVGNSFQETSEQGNNLLDITKISKTKNCTINVEDEKLKVTTTDKSSSVTTYIEIDCSLLAGKYYLHIKPPVSSFNLLFIDAEGSSVSGSTIWSSKAIELSEPSKALRINFAPTEDFELQFSDLYVNAGETDLGYEPFTPNKPSPDYQSEIRNCGDNGNLFDKDNIIKNKTLNWQNGQEITDNKSYASNYMPVKEETDYYLSGTRTAGQYNFFYDKDKNFISTVVAQTGVIRTLKNARYLRFGGLLTETDDIKVEQGTQATPYSPYNCGNVNFMITNNADKEQSISFPTKEGQVFHKGDYLADDGVHHKKVTIEVEGADDENWKEGDTESDKRMMLNNIPKPKYSGVTSLLSTHFKPIQGLSFGNCFITGDKSGIHLGNMIEGNKKWENVDALKQFLKEQKANGTPVKFEYELEEEIIEPYSTEQQEAYDKIKEATSYKNVTHIFSEDEIKPSFEVTYYKDLETLLNNKIASVSNEVQQEVHSEMTNDEPSMEDSVVGGEANE